MFILKQKERFLKIIAIFICSPYFAWRYNGFCGTCRWTPFNFHVVFIGNSPKECNYMPSMSAPKEFVIICHSNILTMMMMTWWTFLKKLVVHTDIETYVLFLYLCSILLFCWCFDMLDVLWNLYAYIYLSSSLYNHVVPVKKDIKKLIPYIPNPLQIY